MSIHIVRVQKPDEEKGGRVINGAIIGPAKKSSKFQVDGSLTLYETRSEALIADKEMEFSAALYEVLGMNAYITSSTFTRDNVLNLFKKKRLQLKDLMNDKRFVLMFKALKDQADAIAIPQEKIPAASKTPVTVVTVLKDFSKLG